MITVLKYYVTNRVVNNPRETMTTVSMYHVTNRDVSNPREAMTTVHRYLSCDQYGCQQ